MNTASLLAKKNQLFEGRPLPGELLPYLDQPGVSDIALGLKMRDGHFTDELSWVIYVQEKIAEAEISPGELIPRWAGDLPTDVQVEFDPREFRFLSGNPDPSRYRNPLTAGIRIGTDAQTGGHTGTLGCFARKNDDRSIVLLSCYHVIFAGQAAKGEYIYQPGGPNNTPNDDAIATIDYGVMGGVADCAIATLELEGSSTCCCKRPMDYRQKITNVYNDPGITISGIRPPANGTIVYKTGIYGPTVGKIIAVGKDTGPVDYTNADLSAGKTFKFSNQILIISYDESTGKDLSTPFLQLGDSGSVVTDNAGFVIGLAFGSQQLSNGIYVAWANDIHEVERVLRITIIPDNPSGVALDPNSPLDSDESTIAAASYDGSGIEVAGRKVEAHVYREPIPEPTVHWVMDAFPELQVGERLEALIRKHAAEITTLVNECRPVTLAWQRSQGPGWLNHFFNSLRSTAHQIPAEVKGTTLPGLIGNMKAVLMQHGSKALQDDLHRYADGFIEACADSQDAMRFLHHLNTRLCLPLQEH